MNKLTILIFLSIFSGLIQAKGVEDLHNDLKQIDRSDEHQRKELFSKYFQKKIDNYSDITKAILFLDSSHDPKMKESYAIDMIKKTSGCKPELYIKVVSHNYSNQTIKEVSNWNNEVINSINKCDSLKKSDEVMIYSRLLWDNMMIKEFWEQASYTAQNLAKNIRDNEILISPRAANTLYYLISHIAIKQCLQFKGENCYAYEQYYPFLKMTHQRIVYEAQNYYDQRIVYPKQTIEIRKLNTPKSAKYFD